jgi:hypothetical protein
MLISTKIHLCLSTLTVTELANIFGCKVESLPFAYVGLPLGTTRPSVSNLMPMVSRIDKKIYLAYPPLCHTLASSLS